MHTAKIIWGRAGARCAMPTCRVHLVLEEAETDNSALIGEMSHIVAESDNGPRGHSSLSTEERDLHSNLILLCRNHHGEIDQKPAIWPVERLRQIKAEHEAWVCTSLSGFDPQKQQDDELYTVYIEQWAKLCHLEEWKSWTSFLFSAGRPCLSKKVHRDLTELYPWILKRVWPKRYPPLEAAMHQFAHILEDLLYVFNQYAETRINSDFLQTQGFYKIKEWNPARYAKLLKKYNYHTSLIKDLTLELTRAANLVCDRVRAEIFPSYYLKEGRLSAQWDEGFDGWKEVVVQYNSEHRALDQQYLGLEAFYVERTTRDYAFGEGVPPPM